MVNSNKNVFQLSGSTWNQMPGTANDIGIGADGTVYIVGIETSNGGFKLYKLVSSDWEQLIAGEGVKITRDSNGKAITVNSYNNIFKQK